MVYFSKELCFIRHYCVDYVYEYVTQLQPNGLPLLEWVLYLLDIWCPHVEAEKKPDFERTLKEHGNIKWNEINTRNLTRIFAPKNGIIHVPDIYTAPPPKWCTPMDHHIWPSKSRKASSNLQQLCEDTGCSPEDLPEAMNDREKWRERVRDIRASGTTWWWCFPNIRGRTEWNHFQER